MVITGDEMKKRRVLVRDESGLTLIEIMVVVVILGILAGIIIPKIMGKPEEARRVQASVQIKSIGGALKFYKLDNGVYPSTEQGLESLVSVPTVGIIPRKWKSDGYISKVPNDPWGNPYLYLSPGAHGDYDLYTYAADATEGGEGDGEDIGSWNIQ